MLIDLVPDFLDIFKHSDPLAAYQRYLDSHRPILSAYWNNYVLDLDSPHAGEVMSSTVRADRSDLNDLLTTVDVARLVEDALHRAEDVLEADRPVDCVLMVGVGAANAGELVVGGRGIAFVCLEHFTGRGNPDTYGLGLSPELLPLWVAHEVAHVIRYTSPKSNSELRRLVSEHGFSIYNLSYRLTADGEQFEYRMVLRALGRESSRALSDALKADRAVLEYRIAPASD